MDWRLFDHVTPDSKVNAMEDEDKCADLFGTVTVTGTMISLEVISSSVSFFVMVLRISEKVIMFWLYGNHPLLAIALLLVLTQAKLFFKHN